MIECYESRGSISLVVIKLKKILEKYIKLLLYMCVTGYESTLLQNWLSANFGRNLTETDNSIL